MQNSSVEARHVSPVGLSHEERLNLLNSFCVCVRVYTPGTRTRTSLVSLTSSLRGCIYTRFLSTVREPLIAAEVLAFERLISSDPTADEETTHSV